MEDNSQPQNLWSRAQVFSLATVCMLAGVAGGYVLRAPKPAPAIPQVQTASEPQPPKHGMDGNISPEQLKHLADKQAEPLLAELQSKPQDAALLAQIAKTYLVAHQFETAVQYYERSAVIKADPRVLTTLGGAYHFQGADAKAIEAWQRALKVDPGYADALFNMGLVKWQSQSDAKSAIELWTRMLKKNPDHPRRAYVEQMIQRAKMHSDPGALAKAAAVN